MCRAKNYINKLDVLIQNIENDYEELRDKEILYDKLQQDCLHKIEANSKFSACDGYKFAKELHDLRVKRRDNKNEIYNLELIKSIIGNLKKSINAMQNNVNEAIVRQSKATYIPKIKNANNISFESMLKDFREQNKLKKKYKYL